MTRRERRIELEHPWLRFASDIVSTGSGTADFEGNDVTSFGDTMALAGWRLTGLQERDIVT